MDLESKLHGWVDAGIISEAQARAIREAERPGDGGRIPVAAQALGYLGGSLALVAAGVTVARFWGSLETWAKLALAALTIVVPTAAGWLTRNAAEPAIRRLTGFLWLGAGGGMAFFMVLLLVDGFGAGEELTLFVAASATAIFTLVLWILRPAAVQQLAFFASAVATVLGALSLVERPPTEFFGFAVWGVGLAWGVLAWGRLARPPGAGYVLSALALLAGAQIFSFGSMRDWGLALGLATAAGLTGASVLLAEGILLGFGAAGVFVFVPQAIYRYVGETLGASLALFLAGMLLLVLALLLARLRGTVTSAGSSQ